MEGKGGVQEPRIPWPLAFKVGGSTLDGLYGVSLLLCRADPSRQMEEGEIEFSDYVKECGIDLNPKQVAGECTLGDCSDRVD
jgi:hypothetical protein